MSDRPLPLPDADSAVFWEGCARDELLITRCSACSHYIHPPRRWCSQCGGTTRPERVSGRGTIFSYTITHRPLPGFEPPFNVVLVELEEQAGLRLVSNLEGDEPEIGMPVEIVFADAGDGVKLPLCRRRR